MIDNFDKILPLLKGDWEVYTNSLSFHVQILQRKKDGFNLSNNNSVGTIVEWFIYSENKLKDLEPAIKLLCEMYHARCYIAVNGKNDEMVLWNLLETTTQRLKNGNKSAKGLFSHVHDTCLGKGSKRWIIDIDDPFVDVEKLITDINSCRSGFSENVICQIPTKSGIHLITHPFDLTQIRLPLKVEIKKNNSTLLYCE